MVEVYDSSVNRVIQVWHPTCVGASILVGWGFTAKMAVDIPNDGIITCGQLCKRTAYLMVQDS